MNDSRPPMRHSVIGRRDFLRVSAGGAAAVGMLSVIPAPAQTAVPQGVPWWAARPGKGGVGQPMAIDLHAHWSPEPYTKALAALGQTVANPYPLDYDLDKRQSRCDLSINR